MSEDIVQKFRNLSMYKNVTYIPFLEDLSPLKQADVMFTDTSSIITEFIIQKKPVITFNNNKPKDSFINITEVNQIKRSIEQALQRSVDLIKKLNHLFY